MDISGLGELAEFPMMPTTSAWWPDHVDRCHPDAIAALFRCAQECGAGGWLRPDSKSRTVAGNLCNASPAADGVPPLLALDAEAELASNAGARRMPLADFIVGNRTTKAVRTSSLTAVWSHERWSTHAQHF